ncbi:hypothetical protein U1872_03620 [Sphingomonas sp. RB3P16]|uniref:hypothetical protein n=1 Tax=Parasphingomonas frigoris TaxID=3096163 RepID=UPI002FC715E4
MSAADQARMLVRLRAARMAHSATALAEARRATAQADADCATAEADAQVAGATLVTAHADLVRDPAAAELRLALVDRSLFAHALARTAANEAADALAHCAETEAERRRALILAQARHDRLAEHVGALERRAAYRAEERTLRDAEDDRSKR